MFWFLVLVGATSVTMLALWWAALLGGQDWHLVIWFNRWHEAWAEGIVLHVTVLLVALATWEALRKAMRHGH